MGIKAFTTLLLVASIVAVASAYVEYSFIVFPANPVGIWTIPVVNNMTCGVLFTGNTGSCSYKDAYQCSVYSTSTNWMVTAYSDTSCYGGICNVKCIDTSGNGFDPAFYSKVSSASSVVVNWLCTVATMIVIVFK